MKPSAFFADRNSEVELLISFQRNLKADDASFVVQEFPNLAPWIRAGDPVEPERPRLFIDLREYCCKKRRKSCHALFSPSALSPSFFVSPLLFACSAVGSVLWLSGDIWLHSFNT